MRYEIQEIFGEGAIQAEPELIDATTVMRALEIWGHDYDDGGEWDGAPVKVRVRLFGERDDAWRKYTVYGEYRLCVYSEEFTGGVR